ncbi:hypothetical protein Ddye_011567 [Dipteronia dyeriana]|uniref:Uncharacterized protein n=1 Tax=Dipteronia dyeriana TaxID=168575 RepID=A0AAD9X2S4_9ROSI|nr:hypothetical protein Ddye_011567 [Dipteronia dyeriana]
MVGSRSSADERKPEVKKKDWRSTATAMYGELEATSRGTRGDELDDGVTEMNWLRSAVCDWVLGFWFSDLRRC